MNRLLQSRTRPASRHLFSFRVTVVFTLAIAAAHCGAFRLSAADIQWSGNANTDWNNPGNWVGGVLPGAGDNAHLDVSGATTDIDSFDDPGFNSAVQQLYVGETNPNATLTQSTGTLNLNGAQAWLKIGANGGSSGIYNLQGTGILSLTNDVFGIGEHGVGSFNLGNGAAATAPRVALGRYAEGRGTIFQSGTTTLTVNDSGNDGNGTPNYGLAIGEQSTALSSYTMAGGTLNVTGGNILVGMVSGSNGRMTLAGTGVVGASHEVHIGESGTGTLVVNGGQINSAAQMIVGNTSGASGAVTQNSGTVSVNGGSLLVLGNQGGGVGSYSLGGGTLNASGRILLGEDGQATFTQTGGANNVTQDISVGDHVGFSTAANPDSYTISAGTLTATGGLQIGWQGYAVVNQSGGTVSTTTDVHFGGSANGNAQNGQGIYNLSGGTLTTPSIYALSAGNLAHQFNFTGGTLRVGNYNTTGVTSILGTLTQTSSAHPSLLDVTTQNTTIGASYNISGQNATATIDNGNTLHVEGIATIDVHAAVTMTANAGNHLTVDGSASNPNNSLNVGVSGPAQLNINGGTFTVTTGDAIIGKNSGSSGVLTQTGGIASFHTASPNWLYVGSSSGSQGTYSLSSGTLTEPNNEEIGFGGMGSFNQTGGTQTVGNIVLGGQATGNGAYALGGGTLIAGSVSGGPGTSTFDFNGGMLQPSANNVAFFQGITSAVVQSGGALIHTNGKNVTVAQNLIHDPGLGAATDGGLIESGAGTLTLSGTSTYTGGTTVNSGTMTTTSSGTIGSGPLAVNAATGITSAVNLGSSQTVSGLSSAVSGTGSATLSIGTGTTLTVNQSSNTTFGGTIVNAGTLVKSGSGTLEIDAAPALVVGSALQINGRTLRLNVNSGTATVGAGTTATIAAGATLQLAGSVAALSAGTNRVNIMNNSQAANGGLLISGTNQQVGNIDGAGNVVVNSGNSLTANHIFQNALLIGGAPGNPAMVIIDASDSSGNPLDGSAAPPPVFLADSLSVSRSFGSEMVCPISATGVIESSIFASGGSGTMIVAAPSVSQTVLDSAASLAAVPEPSSLTLFGLGSVPALLFALRYRRSV